MASLDNYWIICSVLILSTLFKQVYSACNPVEEGEDAVMDCEMTVTEGDSCLFRLFTWKAEVGTSFVTVGTCYPSACVNDSTDVSNVTIRKSGSVYTSELTIASVIRSDAIQDGSEWRCVADAGCGGRTVNACPSLEIYSLPENIVCANEEVYDQQGNVTSIRVICNTSKIYPEAGCLFYHFRNSIQRDDPIETSGKMIAETNYHPVYYSYQCETYYTLADLGVGSHTFYTRIYPNVTGGADLAGVVDTASGELVLTLPTTNIACIPDQINGIFKASSAICTCFVTDEGYPRGKAQWYKGGMEIQQDAEGSITINYDGDDVDTEYICKGKSLLGASQGVSLVPVFSTLTYVTLTSPVEVITEGQSTTLTCQSEGNPPPSLTLTRDRTGEVLPVSSPDGNNLQRIQYLLNDATCQHTDRYICLADNNFTSNTSTFDLFVRCAPQLAKTDTEIPTIGASLEETTVLITGIYGFPEPIDLALARSGNESAPPPHTVTYLPSTPPYGSVVVTVTVMVPEDYTLYTITVNNDVGTMEFSIRVQNRTTETNSNQEDSFNYLALTIGLVLGIIVIITVGGLFYVLRKYQSLKEKSGEPNQAGTYLTPIEETSGHVSTDTPTTNQQRASRLYETVIDPISNMERAQVSATHALDPQNVNLALNQEPGLYDMAVNQDSEPASLYQRMKQLKPLDNYVDVDGISERESNEYNNGFGSVGIQITN